MRSALAEYPAFLLRWPRLVGLAAPGNLIVTLRGSASSVHSIWSISRLDSHAPRRVNRPRGSRRSDSKRDRELAEEAPSHDFPI